MLELTVVMHSLVWVYKINCYQKNRSKQIADNWQFHRWGVMIHKHGSVCIEVFESCCTHIKQNIKFLYTHLEKLNCCFKMLSMFAYGNKVIKNNTKAICQYCSNWISNLCKCEGIWSVRNTSVAFAIALVHYESAVKGCFDTVGRRIWPSVCFRPPSVIDISKRCLHKQMFSVAIFRKIFFSKGDRLLPLV